MDFEDLASTTGDLVSTGNQQLFAQEGVFPLEMSSINPLPQLQRVAEASISTRSKEELLLLSTIVDPLLAPNDEKAGEKLHRREDHSLERAERGKGAAISTPDKESQKTEREYPLGGS